MTCAGARGETATQMRTVLALPEGNAAYEALAAQMKRWDALAKPALDGPSGNDPDTQKYMEQMLEQRRIALHVVNRVWAQTGHPVRPDFAAVLNNSFRAPIAQVDFAHAAEAARVEINKWVSDATRNKIPELLGKRSVTSDTRLVLTNAVYFKASWQTQFQKYATKDGAFHAEGRDSKTPFMQRLGQLSVAKFDGGQLVELPYGAGDIVMDVILPTANNGLPAIETALENGALPSWLAKLSGARVDLALPRWKSSASFDLGETLERLGMKLAFGLPGADFSGIDDMRDLFISAVAHQALVTVDEQGTEAAAATAVAAAGAGAPPSDPPIIFRADHAFVYLIRDTKSGAILFLGRLSDPSKS